MDGSSAIDTGGVRRRAFTAVFLDFVQNTNIHLFDGPANHGRPFSSAESRASGISKLWV